MIKVNGRDREWEENLTVDLLLKTTVNIFPRKNTKIL